MDKLKAIYTKIVYYVKKVVSFFSAENLKAIGSKLLWYVKQLLPLTYRSRYSQDGKLMFCVFNMWFGNVFNSETVEIKGDN